MKDGQRNALLLFLIGAVLLFTYSSLHAPDRVDVRELTANDVGETVMVNGIVHELTVKDEVTFLRLNQRPSLELVVFEPARQDLVNETVTVTGTVSSYHGQLELIVDRIHR